ncbi:hypothetical protein EXE59_21075 [Nocardioides eburneiflavus]|uniref:HTTM domain-containing protein n=1 Tax=Nocardioides eburneiflavus TaxID=2518372 RepID=A0A4Z1C735_9ACTN|nr:hypothetical protein [Nocardioides eburneiflavus]TGN66164.1 hypothetical protein EXE59_21075 [Nocardioides eburneiflavus]
MTSEVDQATTAAVDRDSPRRATALFVRMWAVAHIIHLVAANGSALGSVWSIATVGLACLVVLRPGGRIFAAMLLAQVADYVAEMPGSPDHWALILFVNIAILLNMAAGRSTALPVIERAFPAARTIVLLTYAFAALSKYNTHFLDPVTSCANAIAGRASFGLAGALQDTLVFPLASLALETSVPLLLLIPYSRRHWVRVAMLFHFVLSASPAFSVVDFTSALFAIFVLFLSAAEVDRILDTIGRVAAKSAIVRDARRKPPVTAALAFATFGFAGYASPVVAAALVFVAAEIYLLALLLATLWTWPAGGERQAIGRVPWFHVPVLLLALVWALSPYLGLRTTGVFTMFSGLQTEGTHGNHLFLPTTHLTSWQDDMVTIVESNDPVLDESTTYDLAIPLIALRRMAEDDPSLTVIGTVGGSEVEFGPEAGQTRLEPLSYWEYKLLHFRPVPRGDTPFCSIS